MYRYLLLFLSRFCPCGFSFLTFSYLKYLLIVQSSIYCSVMCLINSFNFFFVKLHSPLILFLCHSPFSFCCLAFVWYFLFSILSCKALPSEDCSLLPVCQLIFCFPSQILHLSPSPFFIQFCACEF